MYEAGDLRNGGPLVVLALSDAVDCNFEVVDGRMRVLAANRIVDDL